MFIWKKSRVSTPLVPPRPYVPIRSIFLSFVSTGWRYCSTWQHKQQLFPHEFRFLGMKVKLEALMVTGQWRWTFSSVSRNKRLSVWVSVWHMYVFRGWRHTHTGAIHLCHGTNFLSSHLLSSSFLLSPLLSSSLNVIYELPVLAVCCVSSWEDS